jgi:DNA-directed RNA polymerase specialized sigma24 family protein
MKDDFLTANGRYENAAVFHTRFWRCHRLLHLIACRVLGGPEQADAAIENCRLKASRNPPRFEHEGAFRSWLLRVLIDEALSVLRERHRTVEPGIPSQRARQSVGTRFSRSQIVELGDS